MVNEEEKSETTRNLVVPGELLGYGRAGHGSYEENGKIFSKFVGMAESRNNIHFVIPLGGVYNPLRGDGIIGRVLDVVFQKWILEINAPYEAILPLSEGVEGYVDLTKADLTQFFDYGDTLFAEITSVSKQKHITLTMRSPRCRKLRGGRLIKVTPTKVPRIIGKAGSMVEMIKQLTSTQIVVGQNGIVWIRGEHEDMATEAITIIEEKSHTSGLTDHIHNFLEQRLKDIGAAVPQLKIGQRDEFVPDDKEPQAIEQNTEAFKPEEVYDETR